MMNPVIAFALLLMERMALVMLIVYLLSKYRLFKKVIRSEGTICDAAGIVIIFSLLSIYGTLRGIPVSGAIANIRDLGPMMAGLLGGPIIGGLTGVIAAIHRYSQGGFTAIPCPIATIFAGVLAGLLSKKIKDGVAYYAGAVALGVSVELVHMGLILVIARPLTEAIQLVEQIAIPMIVANTLGVLIFLYILKEQNLWGNKQ
jgi:sigma-B regulation protein RsbU (phosphoserine phosphatase)